MTNKIDEAYNELVKDQDPPIPNEEKAIWDSVLEDMKDRDLEGLAKYGTRLQPYNGRNPSIDAYQEALDLVVYLKQAIIEREQLVNCLRDITGKVKSIHNHPSFKQVFLVAHTHHQVYDGPRLDGEVEAAERLLKKIGE